MANKIQFEHNRKSKKELKKFILLDKVDDGFNYFLDYR